jgi:UDPglucose 6-dehydrogenase
MKITFINEMADLCEKVGADVQQVAKGIGLDKRIGGKFLNAGPGYGGSCFPKDTIALVRTAHDYGAPTRLIETTVAVNDARKKAMADKVAAAMGTGRPGRQDRRRAGRDLQAQHRRHARRAQPRHPAGPAGQGRQGPGLRSGRRQGSRPHAAGRDFFKAGPYEVAEGADVLLMLTEWDQFRALDLDRLKGLLKDAGRGRPAQRLQARRNGARRLHLRLDRP